MKKITDTDFSKTIEENSVILVDFNAVWCMPCKMLSPILNELEGEYTDGKIMFAEMDVDENPQTSMMFNIQSIPNVKVFKNGKLFKELIGLHRKDDYKEVIDDALVG